jgi:hypothetical protein
MGDRMYNYCDLKGLESPPYAVAREDSEEEMAHGLFLRLLAPCKVFGDSCGLTQGGLLAGGESLVSG